MERMRSVQGKFSPYRVLLLVFIVALGSPNLLGLVNGLPLIQELLAFR